MRTFSHGPVARVAAQALSLTFLWSAVLMGIPLGPAQAQIATARTAVTESVAVVPFENLTRFRPDSLGKEASEAVAAELRDRLSLDVLPAADVELAMRELGLSLPLTDAELIRLATELEVTMVVTGQVRSAELVRDRAGVRGEVVLAVRVFDRITEDSVNGGVVDVKGPSGGPDTTEDTLMSKALQEAAFEALQEMRTRPSVVATVLWCREDNVYISVGARAGLGTGMQLAAIRDGKRIGTVQVTSADSLGSYGQRVSGAVLRPGDQLRGIYKLPSGRVEPNPERTYRKKTHMEKLLIGAAALMGVADLGSASRLMEEGNFAVPGLAASNVANYLDVVMGQVGAGDFSLGASLITWSGVPDPTVNTRLLGFEIWRGNSQSYSLVWVVCPGTMGEKFLVDLPWPFGAMYGYTSFAIDPVTGLPTVEPIVGIDGIDPTNPEPVLAVAATETTLDYTSFWLIGPTPGVTYQYRVRPIIAERVWVSQGVYNWRINHETEFSTIASQVTTVGLPFPGPIITSGTTDTFYFYSPPGADEGILEIARDPNDTFPPDRIYTQTISGLPATSGTWTVQNFNPVNFATLWALPGSGSVFWWRVGCRNRNDTYLPRPWPLTKSNDYNYVWSSTEHLVLPASGSRMVRQQQERQRALLSGTALGRSRILRERPAPDRRVRTQ
jgi:TolB-like protein